VRAPPILERIPKSIKIVILIILLSKFLVFGLGYSVTYIAEGPAPPLSILMNQFYHWDSLHYMAIAENGYVNHGEDQKNLVFFPLYPLLTRLTSIDASLANLSALLISNISSIIAAIYLFKLTRLDFNTNIAKRAVFYLCIFPTAFFLSAIYPEGLFLALAISSFYYARTGKWFLAGSLSMFASLTRIGGLILLPTLLIEYLHQKQWNPRKIDLKILWTSLSILGFLIYLGINNQVSGNPFSFVGLERIYWNQTFNPILGFQDALQRSIGGGFPQNVYGSVQIIFAVSGLMAVIACIVLRFRFSYNIYMVLTWVLCISTSWWNSIPRYAIAMFPMFILLGIAERGRKMSFLIALTIVSFVVTLCLLTALFALGIFVF
jgi:hypothetical protein